MNIISQSHKILTDISEGGKEELKLIEYAGRTCYQSYNKISESEYSAVNMISKFIKLGHMTPLEHSILSVKFDTDRGVSHELVRHRIASFNQESTRYCNYVENGMFGNELTFVRPVGINENMFIYTAWMHGCAECEKSYIQMINAGAHPELARTVLNNSVKTTIVVTANYREWRTIFEQRMSAGAHPQIRDLMVNLCKELQSKIPVVFDGLIPEAYL